LYPWQDHELGIGLATSRSIIENHKGKLWAVPKEGPGSTFGFQMRCAGAAIIATVT
jgi:signal transduction histidine kinase